MFDGMRSDTSTPIGPEGSFLQGMAQGMTECDVERERIHRAQSYGGFEGFSSVAFDYDNNPGGSTIEPCRVISSDPTHHENMPTCNWRRGD